MAGVEWKIAPLILIFKAQNDLNFSSKSHKISQSTHPSPLPNNKNIFKVSFVLIKHFPLINYQKRMFFAVFFFKKFLSENSFFLERG